MTSNVNRWWGDNRYILASVFISVPVWIAINFYLSTLNLTEVETVCTAVTFSFFIALFTGRYMAVPWTRSLRSIPIKWSLASGSIILVCLIWISFHADYPFIGMIAINLLLFWIPLLLLAFVLGISLKIIHATNQNKLKFAEIDAATSKSELLLLQSQMSPHFLFNTLNNLYGLALTDHLRVPPLLLKLSELLRYTVYDVNETFVPLKDEIKYIENYITFEQIRIGDRLVLHKEIEEVTENEVQIAPMLLIGFIENAFKHSKNTSSEKIKVEITLKIWGNSILFYVRNSHSKSEKISMLPGKSSGFGLSTVKKRLQLLYPDHYELNINDDGKTYSVELTLKSK